MDQICRKILNVLLTDKIRTELRLEELLRLLGDEALRKSDTKVDKFFKNISTFKEMDKIVSKSVKPGDIELLLISRIDRSHMPKNIKALFTDKIRFDEDEQEIINLLTGLEDKSLTDKPLTRAHSSVGISFKKMRAYMLKIEELIPEGDIKFLLQIYLSMSRRFYTRCERKLLDEIKKQKERQEYSSD